MDITRRLSEQEVRLLEKWGRLLDDLKSDSLKVNCAKLLENQEQYFLGNLLSQRDLKEAQILAEAGGTASVAVDPSLTGIARLRKVVVPMIRRIFPELITNEVVGVQPMSGPTGLAYALRFLYQNTGGGATAGQEAGYNTINRDYSGPHTTQAGERLNADSLGNVFEGAPGGTTREMGLKVEYQAIVAKTRKLLGRWSMEAEQDLKNIHGLTLEDEITEILSYELSAGIDQEILNYIRQIALAGGVYNWTYTTGGGAGADGRWEQEIFRTFYTKLISASNEIARATRRGPGNFVIASANVVAMLESLAMLQSSPVQTDLNANQVGSAYVGTIGRFKVYRDLFSTTDYAVVGYKGTQEWDAGLIFAPYIPILFSKAIGEEAFHPRLGVMTRYAICDSLFGAQNYYRYIDVNLGGALGTFTTGVSGATAVQYTNASEATLYG